jgi:DNA-binding Lrp family transcriptional regulator
MLGDVRFSPSRDAAGGGAGFLRRPATLAPTDRALIERLQIDGRCSYRTLAADVGITEKMARRRVLELVDSGVIQITAVTDPRTLGYGAGALVGVTLDGSRSAADVARELTVLPAVDYVVVSSGRFAVWVEIFCADLRSMLGVLDGDIRGLAGVREAEPFPYLSVAYQQASFQLGSNKVAAGRGVRPAKLDATDARVIAALTDDGRATHLHIAQELGLSESQVRQRVKRLLETNATTIIAIVNPMTLQPSTMAWLALNVEHTTPLHEVADQLAALPAITYVAICTGRTDVFAELVCESELELLEILETQIRPLPGLQRVETSLYLDLHYRRLRPLAERRIS